jgi:AraC-like DNA-binding protein
MTTSRTPNDLGLSLTLLRPVVAVLRGRGYPCPQVELPPEDDERLAYVPGSLADAVMDAAAAALGDDMLGVSVASGIPIGGLGMIDYALCTSTTLLGALRRVERYYAYSTQRARMRLLTRPPLVSLEFEQLQPGERSRHWVEFALAILAVRIRQTLGRDVQFDEVSVRHAAPRDPAPLERFFGTRMVYSAESDCLTFQAALLDAPLRTAAGSLAELLDARIRELAPALDLGDPFVARVRAAVVRRLDVQDVTLQGVADLLRLKRRTLQRELNNHGTTHLKILDEARRDRAIRLLEEGQLTIAAVSATLGFSEPSAFFRAFRRWTGTSPAAARARTR